MMSIARYRRFVALAVLIGCQGPIQSIAQVGGPTVASLTLSPSTVAGGSGGASTGTVFLNTPAPVGGTLVALFSSNTELAASRPSITVAQGATSATFTVATNPLYRRYSGLAFTVTISASANGSTASAMLTVTAQPRPPDISGDSSQREGFVCGGNFPAMQGEAGILYECFLAPNFGTTGTCTFRQECTLGCKINPPDGFKFNDACATTGPYPVALNPSYIVSGDRPAGILLLDAPAPVGSGGGARSNHPHATVFPSGGVSIPAGATSAGFAVATSYLPSIQFAAISGFVSGRFGLAWLAMAPPDPPPPQPVPTLAFLQVQGGNPVTGGQTTWEIVQVSGLSPSGGPTITLSSSNPAIASVPPSVTIPASSNNALVFITTQPPTTTTTVTLSATDGRYTFSDNLTVQASTCTPTTCAAQGKNCGTISDGCGGTLTCGTCTAPQTCGGGGIPNVCGMASLSSLTLNPTSVTGGNSSQGTVTLTSAAPSGGAVVALSSSNTAVATVPPSVTVAAGLTSATFTVTSKPVAGSAVISASFGGVTKTATLNVTTTPADTVKITLAQYDVAKKQLQVQATSTSTSATLQVFVTATNALIGTLANKGGGKYEGQFSWPTNPSNITVRSSLGGSATGSVTAK